MKTYTIGETIHKFGKKTDIAYNTESGAFIFVDENDFLAIAYPYGKIKGYVEIMIVDKENEDVRDFVFLDDLVVDEDDEVLYMIDKSLDLYIKNFTHQIVAVSKQNANRKFSIIEESVSFTNKVINTLQNIKGER